MRRPPFQILQVLSLLVIAPVITGIMARVGVESRHEVVPSGQQPETIVAYARDHACDLIVLGSHKEGGGLARLLSGMVGEAVARAAPCPVLLVPFTAN